MKSEWHNARWQRGKKVTWVVNWAASGLSDRLEWSKAESFEIWSVLQFLFCFINPIISGFSHDKNVGLWPGMSDMGPKWVWLVLNWTNPGLFQIRFQYILALQAQMYWDLIWSPGFAHLGANLTNFRPKYVLLAVSRIYLNHRRKYILTE